MIPNHDRCLQMFASHAAATVNEQVKVLAGLGCTNVQRIFFGTPEQPLDDHVTLLQAHGLTAKSGHFTLDVFTDHPDMVQDLGTCPTDHLFGDTVPYEPDLAWMVVGGADPLTFLHKYKGCIPAVHVKDLGEPGTCLDEKGFADLGHGVMDWQPPWDASGAAGTHLMVVALDLPSAWTRIERRSINAMRRIGRASA